MHFTPNKLFTNCDYLLHIFIGYCTIMQNFNFELMVKTWHKIIMYHNVKTFDATELQHSVYARGGNVKQVHRIVLSLVVLGYDGGLVVI